MSFDGEELLSRAEQARSEDATASGRVSPVLTFLWGEELYGLPLEDVREVAKLTSVTRVPGLSPSLLGAMNLRGEILPVADVRTFLGLPRGSVSGKARLVVVSHGNERVGLLADGISDIFEVQIPEKTTTSPELVFGQTVLSSGALLSFLDLPRVLARLSEKG